MCIVVYKPSGIKLLDETIKNCFQNNPDGAGFTAVDHGKLITRRGLFSLEKFKEAYTPFEAHQALLHFRIRTHGSYEPDNCHPHYVTSKMVFAHNGVIYSVPHDKDKSDTVMFNELILQNLVRVYGKRIVHDKVVQKLLVSVIGGSKLCFLENTGKYSILPEDGGEWKDKVWFSNSTWKPAPIYEVPQQPIYAPQQRTHKKYKRKYHVVPKNDPTDATQYEARDIYDENGIDYGDIPDPNVELKPRSSELYVTDWIRLLFKMNDLPVGAVGKVLGVYENRTVEVLFPLYKRTMRLAYVCIDRIESFEVESETIDAYYQGVN